MKLRRSALSIILCGVLPVATLLAGDHGVKIRYDGGSIPELKSGTTLALFIESDNVVFKRGGNIVASVPAAAITEISYGQDVHRRVGSAIALGAVSLGIGALMALTKSKKHYVGLVWADGNKKGGLAMQCDKGNYRGILAGLEGVSGKKAVNSESYSVKN